MHVGVGVSKRANSEPPVPNISSTLGIANGGGKQGRGNQPPYRRHGPDTEIQYRPRKPHGPVKPSRSLSKRDTDTEFQYRPQIVATDTIADAVLRTPFPRLLPTFQKLHGTTTKHSTWHFPAGKSVDFPGVADICRKPCDLHSERKNPPSRQWRKLLQNRVAIFSCSGSTAG